MNIQNTGNFVVGNGNSTSAVNTGNISYSEEISEKDWEQLESAFNEVVSKTDINSKEHMLASSAKYQISKKDRIGLRKIIEENLNDFKNSIFSQMVMTGIFELLKKVTGIIF